MSPLNRLGQAAARHARLVILNGCWAGARPAMAAGPPAGRGWFAQRGAPDQVAGP